MRSGNEHDDRTSVLGTRLGRRLIALFLGCALAPLAVFGWLSLSQVSRSLHEENERMLHSSAKTAGMEFARAMLSLREQLEIAAELCAGGAPLAAAPAAVRRELFASFNAIVRLDGQNRTIELGTPRGPLPTLTHEDRESLLGGATQARTFAIPQGNRLGLYRRIGQGKDVGSLAVIYGEVRHDRLLDIESLRGNGSDVLVFDGDCNLMASSLRDAPDLAAMRRQLGAHTSSATFEWRVRGEDHLAHYWRVFLRPQVGMDWLLVHTRPRGSVEAPLLTFQQTFLMTALLTLLLVAITSIAQIRRTIVPIRALVAVTKRVTAGDLDARAALVGRDELSQLGQSFDAMTEDLVENIRRRELIEVDLVAARDAALAAVRAKAEFLTNVSHELRTPLTSIVSSAEILRDFGDDDPATQREFLGIVVDQSERLRRLIEDVLALQTEESSERANVDLGAAVRDALAGLPEPVQQRVRLGLAEGLSPVCGSADRLAYAFRHLLDNAAKFSPEHSPIEVRGALRDGQCVLDFIDRGAGIPATDQQRVFEPFCQLGADMLTQKASGIGLGLALVKKIVEDHGGRVTIASSSSQGTVLRVALPAAVIAPEFPAARAATAATV